jgi:hypothetical protein
MTNGGSQLEAMAEAVSRGGRVAKLLKRFEAESTHRDSLLAVMHELGRRLVNAGFNPVGETRFSCETYDTVSLFVASVEQDWRHPDCDIPFEVVVLLSIFTGGANYGKVSVSLLVADEATGCGVLAGKEIETQTLLAVPAVFANFDVWHKWVMDACAMLKPETFEGELNQLLARLEAATTP